MLGTHKKCATRESWLFLHSVLHFTEQMFIEQIMFLEPHSDIIKGLSKKSSFLKLVSRGCDPRGTSGSRLLIRSPDL